MTDNEISPGITSESDILYGGYRPGTSITEVLKYFQNQSLEPATTVQVFGNASSCVDYIWYQGESLFCNQVLETHNFYEGPHTCPNEQNPSDHYPMVADFII